MIASFDDEMMALEQFRTQSTAASAKSHLESVRWPFNDAWVREVVPEYRAGVYAVFSSDLHAGIKCL